MSDDDAEIILRTEGLAKHYGGVRALYDADFALSPTADNVSDTGHDKRQWSGHASHPLGARGGKSLQLD